MRIIRQRAKSLVNNPALSYIAIAILTFSIALHHSLISVQNTLDPRDDKLLSLQVELHKGDSFLNYRSHLQSPYLV